MTINFTITSASKYLPTKSLSNEDLARIVNTSDEWIFNMTGIKKRLIADESELTSDLAAKAALNCLELAGLEASEIDLILVATTTPDLTFPSTACIVQNKIKATKAAAFDIQAACSGFVYALSVADSLGKTLNYKNILVIGAETLSRIMDWEDRATCVLFGDGAGAVLLQRCEENRGFIDHIISSNGDLANILNVDGGVSLNQRAGFMRMNGREVFKAASNKMAEVVEDILVRNNLDINQIKFLIPHQANIRIIEMVAAKLKLDPVKAYANIQDYANTAAATIPICFAELFEKKKLNKGDIIVTVAAGAGFTWGANILTI